MIRQHSTNELMILWVFIFFSCLFEMVEPLPVINTDALLIFPPGCGTEGTRRTYGTNTSGILGILWVCFSSGVAACSETQRLLSLLHHTGTPRRTRPARRPRREGGEGQASVELL